MFLKIVFNYKNSYNRASLKDSLSNSKIKILLKRKKLNKYQKKTLPFKKNKPLNEIILDIIIMIIRNSLLKINKKRLKLIFINKNH